MPALHNPTPISNPLFLPPQMLGRHLSIFCPWGNMDAGELMALMIVPMVSLPGTGQTLELGVGGKEEETGLSLGS